MSTEATDFWATVEGGFRGSTMLRAGALLAASGSLTNLGARLLANGTAEFQEVTITAWVLYIVGLWILALGFTWVGSHPFLTRFGYILGTLHLLQGTYLLVLLFTPIDAVVPPVSLTVGRLLATILFAFVEKSWLSRQVRDLLAGSAAFILAKSVTRSLGWWPDLGIPLDPLIETVALLALATALLQLAAAVRIEEDKWARKIHVSAHAYLDDFNNPEHEWNRDADRNP